MKTLWPRRTTILGLCFFCVLQLAAQKEKREPLTEAQIDEIREAGIVPDLRIGLYTKFLNERAEKLKALSKRAPSAARAHRLNEDLLDFTALLDELSGNLDQYGERKADLRKALKALNGDASRWLEQLRALTPEPAFDLALKEAVESGKDLSDQASTLLTEQNNYFVIHKDEKDQQRAEPK